MCEDVGVCVHFSPAPNRHAHLPPTSNALTPAPPPNLTRPHPPPSPTAIRSRLIMYYTTTASSADRNLLIFPDVKLDDGVVHSFLLQLVYSAEIDTTRVRFFLDGREQEELSISGQLTDCGARSPTCGLAVGQRLDDNADGGNFGMDGTVQLLRLYPTGVLELQDAPSVSLAGPPFFSVQTGKYIPGENQGGAFRTGVSADECARRCLDDALCLSFDAGTVGLSQEGACYLSYISESSSTQAVVVASPLFNYYERL